MFLLMRGPAPPSRLLGGWWWPALLVAITIATYSNSFSGVIEGDASALVTSDARVHAATRDNFRLIANRTYWSAVTSSTVFRPLVTLSWMLNYVGFGNRERALGYHVFNLAVHLINVILAWLLILRILGHALPAFLSAAVFAIHPVNSEAVTNIAGRGDLMAATGVLAGLLLYVYISDWTGWRRNIALAGLVLASAFGFLSKENAVVLPLAMLLYDLFFRRRIRAAPYLAVLTPVVAILAWRYWMLPGVMDNIVVVDNPLAAAGFWKARLTAIEVLWRYLALLVWPRQLSWDYSYNQIPLATTTGGLIALTGLLGLSCILVSLYRRATAICFFGFLFFLLFAPTSNVPFLIGSILAERFLYLPSVAFAVCAVAAVIAIGRIVPARPQVVAACVFVPVLLALGARTWHRNLDWTDGVRLWESGVAVSPNSFKTHLARINVFSRQGLDSFTLEESIEEAKKAAAIVADLPPAQSTAKPLATLGSLYQLKGDILARQQEMAATSFASLTITDPPESPNQWYEKALDTFSQAVALDRMQSTAEKQRQLDRGIPTDRIREGGSSFLYSHLGDTYLRLGRFQEALDAFRHLSAIVPTDAPVYGQIGQLLQTMGHTEDAIVARWQAESLQPSEVNELDLVRSYRQLDPNGCAVSDGQLNQSCPLVMVHQCRAQIELADRVAQSGLREESARLRQAAEALGCGK